jgi:hypothetical protein
MGETGVTRENKKAICPFRETCHFFIITARTPEIKQLTEVYCDNRPYKCAIYKAKIADTPVSITLWPTGELTR